MPIIIKIIPVWQNGLETETISAFLTTPLARQASFTEVAMAGVAPELLLCRCHILSTASRRAVPDGLWFRARWLIPTGQTLYGGVYWSALNPSNIHVDPHPNEVFQQNVFNYQRKPTPSARDHRKGASPFLSNLVIVLKAHS